MNKLRWVLRFLLPIVVLAAGMGGVGVRTSMREEPDQPWRFKVLERTFLLYVLGATFLVATTGMLFASLQLPSLVGPACGIAAVLSFAYYPMVLAAARRHHQAENPPATPVSS